jgi:5-methylcytosine-specific restriction endonuclease McrA
MWHPRMPTALPFEEQDRDSRATFDHKIPASRGGKRTKENGVAACSSCNNHRGDTPFEEYEQWPPE